MVEVEEISYRHKITREPIVIEDNRRKTETSKKGANNHISKR